MLEDRRIGDGAKAAEVVYAEGRDADHALAVGLQRELQVHPFAVQGAAAAETHAALLVGGQHCVSAAQPVRVQLHQDGRRPVEDRVRLRVALAVEDVHRQADLELMSGGIRGTVVGVGVHPDVVYGIPRPGGERDRRDAVWGLDGGLAARVDRAGGLGCGVAAGDIVNVGNLDGHYGEVGAPAAVGDAHAEGVGGLDLEVQLRAYGQLPGSVVDGEECRVDASAGVCKRIAVGVGGCERSADIGALGGLFGHRPLRPVAFGEHRGLVGLAAAAGAVVHHIVVAVPHVVVVGAVDFHCRGGVLGRRGADVGVRKRVLLHGAAGRFRRELRRAVGLGLSRLKR